MSEKKKALEITGCLMAPLMVGAPAMVVEKCNCLLYTSDAADE